MKQIKTTILCLFLVGISTTSNAQFWKKLQKKIEKKIEKKVEDKIDKETDKVIDDTLNGKPKSKEPKIKQSIKLPKFTGGSGILKLNNYGYQYITKDIGISVYGKFTQNSLANSVKTYNEDRIIKPVDAYPEGYALAFNGEGFLNPKEGQIIIHHADTKKIIFSLKGTWNTIGGDEPINGSYISLNVSSIEDSRVDNNNEFVYKKKNESLNNTSTSSNNSIFNKNTTSVSIPDSFSFTSSLEMQMTSNGSESANMEFLLGNYSDIYAMSISSKEMGENANVYNVITPKSITMFISAAGMKIKKTVPQEKYSQADFSDKVPNNPEDLKKTGASKSILGYACYEYKYEKDGTSFTVWATKSFPMQGANITMLGMHEGGVIDGFVLELSWESGKETASMKAIKYNKNKNITINTTEYKSMGF